MSLMMIKVAKPGDVVTLKLVTGEEVVGSLVSDANGVIRVRKPFSIGINPGNQEPAFFPLLMTVDVLHDSCVDDLEFNKSTVICMAPSMPTFAKAYDASTSAIRT